MCFSIVIWNPDKFSKMSMRVPDCLEASGKYSVWAFSQKCSFLTPSSIQNKTLFLKPTPPTPVSTEEERSVDRALPSASTRATLGQQFAPDEALAAHPAMDRENLTTVINQKSSAFYTTSSCHWFRLTPSQPESTSLRCGSTAVSYVIKSEIIINTNSILVLWGIS